MTEYELGRDGELISLPDGRIESEPALTYEDIKLAAEADYYAAGTELAKVQREHERTNARISAHNLAEAQRASDWDRTSSVEHRVYHFCYPFGHGSCTSCMEYLSRWAREDITKPVEVMLTSPGGDVMHGMALFDHTTALRQQGLHVQATVRGVAASMAAVYLQAADERVMGPASMLLVHKGSAELEGTLDQLKDMQAWLDSTHDQVIDIFVQRTGQSRRVVTGWFDRKDSSFTPKEALAKGLIDRIG